MIRTGVIVLLCLVSPGWPQDASAYPAAVAHVRQNRFQAAIPLLEAILVRTPNDLKARNLLGIALMGLERRTEATAQFQKALAVDPRFHPALKNLAVNEFTMGQFKDAKAHFERAAVLVPDDAVVRFHLGQIYFREQRYREAAAQLELARNGFSGREKAAVYNLLSRAYSQSGRVQEAYDALRTATQIDPREESNYLDLMLLCLEHENWDLSLEISAVALQNIPQAYKVRLQRGAVFALKGQLEDAESEFAAASKAAPKVNLPYVALALVQIEQKKFAEAAQGLRRRRMASPNDYLVNWILAEALIEDGAEPGSAAEKEAFLALENAARVNPGAAKPRALLAGLLVKRSESARAAREFEAALKLDPSDAGVAYQLAVLYQKTGNARRAEELFNQVAKARAEDPARPAPSSLVRIIREGSR